MKTWFFLLFLINLSLPLRGQYIQPARVMSQAYNSYTEQGLDGLFSNQAGLHTINQPAVSASAVQRYFSEGVTELHLGGAFSLGEYTGGGVYLRRFGDDIFSEQSAGFGIGRRLFENFALGIALEVYQLNIENYANEFQFNSQLGFQATISKSLRISSHLFLPLQSEEQLTYSNQAAFNFDVSVQADKHLVIKGGIRKITDQDFGAKVAINYYPGERFEIHAGALTFPAMYTFGAGIELIEHIQVMLTGFYQPELGWSSGLNLRYAPGS